MDDTRQLSKEVQRILLSPYRVGLKKLFDAVSRTSQHALQLWARGNQCQIDALAAAMLDGSDGAPFALDIIRLLACVVPFRDAVFTQKPILLDTLLTNAVESSAGFQKYATTCTALLSAPLDVPEPAILPAFIIKLLDRAVQAPSISSIRPIYVVFKGLRLELHGNLSINLLVLLQDELIKMLKNLEAGDHSANLICLAILGKIASTDFPHPMPLDWPTAVDDRSSSSTNPGEVVQKSVESFGSARQFFTTKRSAKTLDLVSLKVIQACSQSCMLSVAEAIECLEISREILDVMDTRERKSWLLKNGARVKKICEKVLRQDLVGGVKCAAFSFIVTLTEDEQLPLEIISSFQTLFLSSDLLTIAPTIFGKYVIQWDEPAVCAVLGDLIRLACSGDMPTIKSLAQVENALSLSSGLAIRIEDSATLRQAVVCSLSSNKLSDSVRFLVLNPHFSTTAPHEKLNICPHRYQQARLDLYRNICNLFLKASLCAYHDTLNVDASVATAILERQMSISSSPSACHFYEHGGPASVAHPVWLQEIETKPLVDIFSRGWRDVLHETMSKSSESQYYATVKMVGTICQDLELRCDGAERPFREEKSRSAELNRQLIASEAKLKELDLQARERTLVLESLEAENSRLIKEGQETGRQLQSLASTHQLLRQEFDQATQDAGHATRIAQENMKQQELSHLAVLIGRDEAYEEQNSALLELRNHTTQLADELEQMKLQGADSKERITKLESLLHEKGEALERASLLAASRKTEIDRFVNREEKLLIDKSALQLNLALSEKQFECLKAELETTSMTFETENGKLRLKHEKYLSEMDDKIKQEIESYKVRIYELRQQLDDVSKNAILVTKQSKQSITKLEEELTILRYEREKRAKEFMEAQELSSKLMAVMGAKPPQQLAPDLPSRDASQFPNFQEKHLPYDTSSDPKISTGSLSGPTPKRTKTYRNLNSPPSHRARAVANSNNVKSIRDIILRGKRSPLGSLGDTTQNVDICTPTQFLQQRLVPLEGVTELEKENRSPNPTMDIVDESFGDSEIFTITNQHCLSAQRNEMYTDDTTLEF